MIYMLLTILLIACILAYFLYREIKSHDKTKADLRAEKIWNEMLQSEADKQMEDAKEFVRKEGVKQ